MYVIIRPAEISDIEALRQLNTQIFEEINSACDDDLIPKFAETEAGLIWITKMVNRKDDGCCFVAESDGKLAGYVSGEKMEQLYRKSQWFEIDNIGVIPEFKGQGIGKQLLDAAMGWAKDKGCQKAHIICYAANKAACRFYEHAGFKNVDVTYEMDII